MTPQAQARVESVAGAVRLETNFDPSTRTRAAVCWPWLTLAPIPTRVSCELRGDAVIVMSHSLLWRHVVLLMVGVYSSNHRVLYIIGISIRRRFQKSVGPSVCLCLSVRPIVIITKAYSSFIIDSKKIIRISGERAYHPLQENEKIFSKNIFQKF